MPRKSPIDKEAAAARAKIGAKRQATGTQTDLREDVACNDSQPEMQQQQNAAAGNAADPVQRELLALRAKTAQQDICISAMEDQNKQQQQQYEELNKVVVKQQQQFEELQEKFVQLEAAINEGKDGQLAMAKQLAELVKEIQAQRGEFQQQRDDQQQQQQREHTEQLQKCLFVRVPEDKGDGVSVLDRIREVNADMLPASVKMTVIKQKSAPASYAEAASREADSGPAQHSTGTDKDAPGPSGAQQQSQQQQREPTTLYRLTFANKQDARRVLLAKGELRRRGMRVDEVLSKEELALKRKFLSAGLQSKVWEIKGEKTDWRRGQLVRFDKETSKWVSVPLTFSSDQEQP